MNRFILRFAGKSVARRFTKKVDSHDSVDSKCRVDSWSRFMETIHGKVHVANLSCSGDWRANEPEE